MQKKVVDNKNIIHSKGIIDENCVLISADEELFRFIGPNIKLFTDSVHQIDLDDFLYVLDQLNEFAPKNLVIRVRRFDNTYRWCLVTLKKLQINSVEHSNIELEISDVINLNNHYMALNKFFDTNKKILNYDKLLTSEQLLAIIESEVNAKTTEKLILIDFSIDNTEEMVKNYGREFFNQMLDEIATELNDCVGERGHIASYEDNSFLILLRNVETESDLRSFIGATRSKIRWMYASRTSALDMTFTLAVIEYPKNGSNMELLKKKLYKANEIAHTKGGNCYVIYKEELHGEL